MNRVPVGPDAQFAEVEEVKGLIDGLSDEQCDPLIRGIGSSGTPLNKELKEQGVKGFYREPQGLANRQTQLNSVQTNRIYANSSITDRKASGVPLVTQLKPTRSKERETYGSMHGEYARDKADSWKWVEWLGRLPGQME